MGKNKKDKVLTWGELRRFCNDLPKKYDNEEVRWLGDERGGRINTAERFKEDHVNPSGEGIEPISAYKDDDDYWQIKQDVVFEKGHPALWTDLD